MDSRLTDAEQALAMHKEVIDAEFGRVQPKTSPTLRLLEAMNDAISIMESGSDYERAHVVSILKGGITAFNAEKR